MKLKHTKVATLAATLITFGSLAGGANAAISFTSMGNDLVVNITSPISFSVTTALATDTRWGLRLENVFTVAQSTNIVPGSTTSTIDLAGTTSTTTLNQHGVFTFGSTTGQDLFVFWNPPSYTPTINDSISISSGTFTLNGFLDSGISPDTVATSTTASIIQGANGKAIASTSVALLAIPEPSSALLLGLGALSLLARRKRTA